MKRFTITLCIIIFAALTANAQKEPDLAKPLPYRVDNIELRDLNNEPSKLPSYGEKNLIFFYIDPDRHKQNEEFTYEIERRHAATGPNILGFGILNLKDTMLPNGIIRSMARKRTEKNNAIVLTDIDRSLQKAWGLGNCNNMFVLIIVNKAGEMVYCKKGELSPQEQEEFFEIIKHYQ